MGFRGVGDTCLGPGFSVKTGLLSLDVGAQSRDRSWCIYSPTNGSERVLLAAELEERQKSGKSFADLYPIQFGQSYGLKLGLTKSPSQPRHN